MTRRSFARIAVATPLAVAARPAVSKINSIIDGVKIGAQTYSFRGMSLDDCIDGMKSIRLGYAELWQGQIEPKDPAALQAWRSNPPMDEIRAVRRKFDQAGIDLYAFNYSMNDRFTTQQIEKGFEMAKAMGVNKITASSNIDLAPQLDHFAQLYKVYVAFHNHDGMKPNEFSTPDDWKAALDGRSKYLGINLDIGHFTAANFDPVSFLGQNHARILTLHIKDMKKDHGGYVPWGQGDANIRGTLQLLKTEKYPIPAMIEYEYGKPGMDAVAEVKKCLEFSRRALAG
jgi:sugar phosphate isomerase/epimerase